ncbi:expressed unknown protein [Seminavis robusta]|uniref:Uncharacterized protein n=1 Tax=Seminavis robusta TaxID=568900 RepID=A0A9N8DBF3_9STRA|nr:expressed unknown protein [Seminavis robusta]|eukprot:Sro68_g038240.1 n/a (411) ;mRNA; r:91858-93328
MAPMPALTAAERLDAIDDFSSQFQHHLMNVRGVALTASLRLAIVNYAREAIFCSECSDQLPQSACLKPGTNFFAMIAKIEHNKNASADTEIPDTTAKILRAIVHSIVNHQGRLDATWYDNVIHSILETKGILPQETDEEEEESNSQQRQYLAYAAFAEILILTCMSHCLHVAFLVLGRPLPALPSQSELKDGLSAKQGPTLLDWTSLLKRAPRRNPKICFTPFVYSGDFNKRSPDFRQISKEAWHTMQGMMDRTAPELPLGFAVEDTVFMGQMGELFAVPDKDFMALYNTELDPALRCADDFTRYDTEFISTKVAEAYNYVIPGREEALQGLVAAVTCRPVDLATVSKARDVVLQDQGEGTLVEAAVVLGLTDAVTKVTDATGKQPLAGLLWTFLKFVFAILRYLYEKWM